MRIYFVNKRFYFVCMYLYFLFKSLSYFSLSSLLMKLTLYLYFIHLKQLRAILTFSHISISDSNNSDYVLPEDTDFIPIFCLSSFAFLVLFAKTCNQLLPRRPFVRKHSHPLIYFIKYTKKCDNYIYLVTLTAV